VPRTIILRAKKRAKLGTKFLEETESRNILYKFLLQEKKFSGLTYQRIRASVAVARETFGDLQELSSARCVPQQIGVGHGNLLASSDGQHGAHV